MKVLITGASGLLGAHLAALLSGLYRVVGLDRHPWWGDKPLDLLLGDLTDGPWVLKALAQVSPQVVIHCAAMSNVDACERNPESATSCNVEVTRNLVRALPADCLFVYVSTDGIFRGEESFAREENPPSPLTVYGHTKLQGEEVVRQATRNHLILRTNFYGWSSGRKQTSAEWLYSSLQREEPITLFEDFFFTPIYVVHLAWRLQHLLATDFRGVFHLCGSERVSKSQFAEKLAHLAGFSMRNTRRGSLRGARLLAPRPGDMSLDCSRYKRLTGMDLPDCSSGLRRLLSDRGVPLSERVSRAEASHAVVFPALPKQQTLR